MRRRLRLRLSAPLLGAVTVVGVGVGLAATVFALADPALRSLPYTDPDGLVSISFGLPPPGPLASQADVPTLADFQAHRDLFVGVAAFLDQGWLRVRLSDRVLPLRAVAATDNLLEVLGLPSRFADPDPTAARVSRHAATLSGGELEAGRSAPIVPEGLLRVKGLLPDSFLLPEADRTEAVDALVNLPGGPVIKIAGVSSQSLGLVARIRPGVTRQTVEATLDVDMLRVGRRVSVVPLSTALNTRLRGLAMGALVASGLVVLVCWTNVFSIALTRGLYRAPEIATRTALGATPSRIASLLVRDAVKIATLGSGGALAVTYFALAGALTALPPQFATLGAPSITARVVLFVVVAGAAGGLSWCIASIGAWKLGAQRQAVHLVSRDGGAIRTVRFLLIAGQLAAASMLLVGSALLGHSYLNLMRVDAGLDDRTQVATVAHDPGIPVALRRDVVERTVMAFRQVSGVAAAGASSGPLLDGRANAGGVVIDHHLAFPDWTFLVGNYFAALGLMFVEGAAPEHGDVDSAVITETAARELFAGRSPIGAVLSRGRDYRVVGVVRDVRFRGLNVPPKPTVFLQTGGWTGTQPQTTYALRMADSSVSVPWERIARAVDPLAVVLDAGSIRDRLDRSVRDRTFATLVVGLFALASLVVVALGLAGVVAYTVVRRTREIAIRLVLGASAEGVTTLVIRDALTAAACGVTGGVMASIWLSRVLESLLYGIHAADPVTLAVTAFTLLGGVLVVATLPGIRAGRVEPSSALRNE